MTGRSARNLLMSSPRCLAVSYRRVGSFSRHFMTTQSRSPLSIFLISFKFCFIELCVFACGVFCRLILVLGFLGISSRMILSIFSKPAFCSVLSLNGWFPVSNS